MKTKYFNELFKANCEPSFLLAISSLGQQWRWISTAGVLHLILAVLALSMSTLSFPDLNYRLAILLILSGFIQIVQAIHLRHELSGGTNFLESALSIIIGCLMFRYPNAGYVGVALCLSFYFLIGAILQWVFFTEVRPHGGWNWGIISAVSSFILGAVIVMTFPFAAPWIPGSLLAIDFALAGAGTLGFALSVRKYQRHPEKERYQDQDLFNEAPDQSLYFPTTL